MIVSNININSLKKGLDSLSEKIDNGKNTIIPHIDLIKLNQGISLNVSSLDIQIDNVVEGLTELDIIEQLEVVEEIKKSEELEVVNIVEETKIEEEIIISSSYKGTLNLISGNILGLNMNKLKKGTYLYVKPNLRKGVSLMLYCNLRKGMKLGLCLCLRKGKNIEIKNTAREKLQDIENKKIRVIQKEKELKTVEDITIINTDDIKKEVQKENTEDIVKEQKGEKDNLVEIKDTKNIEALDKKDDILFKVGMSLYDFLKENKKNRTEEVVLRYFNKSDLDDLLKRGKVLKKRGKLII